MQCAICLADVDFATQRVEYLPCTHCFHTECIRRWNKNECPVCRTPRGTIVAPADDGHHDAVGSQAAAIRDEEVARSSQQQEQQRTHREVLEIFLREFSREGTHLREHGVAGLMYSVPPSYISSQRVYFHSRPLTRIDEAATGCHGGHSRPLTRMDEAATGCHGGAEPVIEELSGQEASLFFVEPRTQWMEQYLHNGPPAVGAAPAHGRSHSADRNRSPQPIRHEGPAWWESWGSWEQNVSDLKRRCC